MPYSLGPFNKIDEIEFVEIVLDDLEVIDLFHFLFYRMTVYLLVLTGIVILMGSILLACLGSFSLGIALLDILLLMSPLADLRSIYMSIAY